MAPKFDKIWPNFFMGFVFFVVAFPNLEGVGAHFSKFFFQKMKNISFFVCVFHERIYETKKNGFFKTIEATHRFSLCFSCSLESDTRTTISSSLE